MNNEIIPIPVKPINCFLIKGERNILVDTGYPGNKKQIADTLLKNGIALEDISLIVITHGHCDHFGSLFELKEQTDTRVLVHEYEKDALINKEESALIPVDLISRLSILVYNSILKKSIFKRIHPVMPDIIINDDYPLDEFGINGKIITTPGHTSGSISIVLENYAVIIGDLLTGKPDNPGLSFFCENKTALIDSIKKILEYNPQTIYASHGGPFMPNKIKELLEG